MATDVGNVNDYMNQSGSPFDTASGGGGFDIGSLLNLGSDALSFASGGSPLSFLGAGGPLSAMFGGNSEIGSLFGFLPGLLGGLLTGVPTGAKTSGAIGSLEGTGDPMSTMLAQLMQSFGGGQGSNVLSNPAFAKETNTGADILSWLSGQAFPGYKPMGTTGEIAGLKPPPGSPYSKPVNIMGIQSPAQLIAELGKSPHLGPGAIESLMPMIEQLVSGGGNLESLKGPLSKLAAGAGGAGGAGTSGAAASGLNFVDSTAGQNDQLQALLRALVQKQGGGASASPWDQMAA